MERTIDFIERLRARNDGCSNYRIAKLLGVDQSAVIRYTKHGKSMDDKYAIRMAELLGIDPAYVLACMAAERSHSVESTKQWERIAAHFAACFVVAVACMPLFSGYF